MYGVASWNPAGEVYTKRSDCSHPPIIDAVLIVKAESEVVLLPLSIFFASMLMMHAAVRLCGGWCCQIGCFSRYRLRPVYGETVRERQNEHVHNNVHQAEIQYVQFTFAQNMKFMNDRSGTTLRIGFRSRTLWRKNLPGASSGSALIQRRSPAGGDLRDHFLTCWIIKVIYLHSCWSAWLQQWSGADC